MRAAPAHNLCQAAAIAESRWDFEGNRIKQPGDESVSARDQATARVCEGEELRSQAADPTEPVGESGGDLGCREEVTFELVAVGCNATAPRIQGSPGTWPNTSLAGNRR